MTETAQLTIIKIKTGDKATGWFGRARCDMRCQNLEGVCYNGAVINKSEHNYLENLPACCKTAGAKTWTFKYEKSPWPGSKAFYTRGWRDVLELEVIE